MTKPNFTNVSSEDDLRWKMNLNIKSYLSQQPVDGSSLRVKDVTYEFLAENEGKTKRKS